MEAFSIDVSVPEHIVRLAGEGVPIAAIARGLCTSFDQVHGMLQEAMMRGQLAEMPASDWPLGTRGYRQPSRNLLPGGDNFEHCISWLCMQFALSPQEARMLYALTSPRLISKESLHHAISEGTQKVVETVVCRLRQKLRQHRPWVSIATLWGRGYFIEEKARKRLRAEILAGAADYAAESFKQAG